MSNLVRRVYVISDLHLGGRDPDPATGDRGFRMMTHPRDLATFLTKLAEKPRAPVCELVINGDFIDFLAEQLPGETEWKAFRERPGEALLVFKQLLDRPGDRAVLDALGAMLKNGHRVTVLLGNHDVELALPEVREAFEEAVGAGHNPGVLRWVVNNEAYVVGDALIEHGNRYDAANQVDHDGLRRLCSMRSRGLYSDEGRAEYRSPPGSLFVAEIMNPIKQDYSFIDLLKPQSEPLFALILALAPEHRKRVLELIAILKKITEGGMDSPTLPSELHHITAQGGGEVELSDEEVERRATAALLDSITDSVSEREALASALEALSQGDESTAPETVPIANTLSRVVAATGLLALVSAGNLLPLKYRVPLVRKTLGTLAGDKTFDDATETGAAYLAAAQALAAPRTPAELDLMPASRDRFRYVVFGHTHHPKKLALPGGDATYLNTGTWANVMRFPRELFAADDDTAGEALVSFVERVRKNDLDDMIVFRPTYVRLDVGADGRVASADLVEYDPKTASVP